MTVAAEHLHTPGENTRDDWKNTILAGLANYIDAGSIVSGAVALALWKEEFHLTDTFIGVIAAFSANAISAGVGALIGGRLCGLVAFAQHHPAHVFQHLGAVLPAAGRAHEHDAGLAARVLLEPDDLGGRIEGVARIDRGEEAAARIALVTGVLRPGAEEAGDELTIGRNLGSRLSAFALRGGAAEGLGLRCALERPEHGVLSCGVVEERLSGDVDPAGRHRVQLDPSLRRLERSGPVVDLCTEERALVLGVEAVALGEEVLERAGLRPAWRPAGTIRGAEGLGLVARAVEDDPLAATL